MSRIDEIKERIKPGTVIDFGTAGDLANIYFADTQYLLSLIDQYGKAFDEADKLLTDRWIIRNFEGNNERDQGMGEAYIDAGKILKHLRREAEMSEEEKKAEERKKILDTLKFLQEHPLN